MTKFTLARVLQFEKDDLFEMVSDVSAYPKFVPWITKLRPYNHHEEGTKTIYDADISAGFKIFSETFSTRVIIDRDDKTIIMKLLKGPFKQLLGTWTFSNHERATLVQLEMNLEINNPLLNIVFNANYEHAANKIMNLFEARAKEICRPL